MRVLLIERQNGYRMYEVHDGPKWWTARHNVVTGDWYVVNSKLTPLRDWLKLWLKVVGAAEKWAKDNVN